MKKTVCAAFLVLIALIFASCISTNANNQTDSPGETNIVEKYERYILSDPEFGAIPDDEKDDADALNKAISKANGNKVYICIPNGEYTISSDVTIPSNITLAFERGGYFYTADNVTVTLDGCKVESVPQSIFGGDGLYKGHSPSEAYMMWLGASGNGKNCSDRVQMAVDIFDTVKLTNGTSSWSFDNINITKPVSIIGEGSVRVTIYHSSKKNTFNISSDNVTFRNLAIAGNANCKDSAVFYFDTSKCSMSNILIDNCTGSSNGYAVKDAENGKNHVSNFTMTSSNFSVNYNEGIYITDFSSGIVFKDVVINNVPGPGNLTYAGWYLKNVTEMFMDNIDAAGGLGGGHDGAGFIFENCSNVKIARGMQDYVCGNGLELRNCTKMDINNMVCSLYEGYGFYMENVTDSVFNMIIANGDYPNVKCAETRGVVYDAVKLVNCSNLTFNSMTMTYNQSNGLVVENSNHITVNSLICSTGCGDCYIEKGNSDYNILNGVSNAGNYYGKSSLIQVGEHSKMLGVSLNFDDPRSAEGPATIK